MFHQPMGRLLGIPGLDLGADFEPGISVFFGTRAAQQVAVVSSSLITALVPAETLPRWSMSQLKMSMVQ